MAAFETLSRYYNQHHSFARDWKRKGGKVVGYFCTNTPAEIIEAADMLPVRIVADPGEEITLADTYMEDICCPFVRSCFDLLIKRKFDYLDAIALPRSCDALIRAYYCLLEAASRYELPPIFFIDVPRKFGLGQTRYLIEEFNEFKQFLKAIAGGNISDENLIESINVFNKNRTLLKEVDNLRKELRISGVEAYQVIGAGSWIPKKMHNQLIQQYLVDEHETKIDPESVKVFLTGSVQDNLNFISLVEDSGAVIVSDDLCMGTRYYADPVELKPLLNPTESLAERYLGKSPCARVIPTQARIDYFKQMVSESKAEGVIFYFLKWCDVIGWDYPRIQAELEKMSIDSILFEGQEYQLAAAQRQSIRLETFVESIRERRQ